MNRSARWLRSALLSLSSLAACHPAPVTPTPAPPDLAHGPDDPPVFDGGVRPDAQHHPRCLTPSAFVVGDFDRDGHGDLALACANGVGVRLRDGQGGFAVERLLPLPFAPGAIASADLDGDGNLDLAVTASDSVQIWHGDGHGGFAGASPLSAVATDDLRSLVVADLDDDGQPDVVAADWRNRALLWPGAQAAAQRTLALDVAPDELLLAPLGPSGKPGLLVLSHVDGAIRYLRGAGDGSFTVDASVDVGGRIPEAAVVADVDGDRLPDLVASTRGLASGDQAQILTWLGDGQGGLAAPIANGCNGPSCFELGSTPLALDLNGDGWIDLEGPLAGGLRAWNGDSEGHFESLTSLQNRVPQLSLADDGAALQLADLDGTGALSQVVVLPNGLVYVAPAGFAQAGTTWSGGSSSYDGAQIVDLDGDGDPDVVATSSANGSATLWRGDGSGQLVAQRDLMLMTPFVAADFDGDGKPELLSLFWGQLVRAGATVSTLLPSALAGSFPAAAGDLDGDGRADLIFGSGSLSVELGDAQAMLAPPVRLSPSTIAYPAQLATGQVDGDGRLDVVLLGINPSDGGEDWALATVRGPGNALDYGKALPAQPAPSSDQLLTGDFDGDGKLDVMLRTHDGRMLLGSGRGDGSFSLDPAAAGIAGWSSDGDAVAADFDGDGALDLVSGRQGATARQLDLWRGDGHGGFTLVRSLAGVRPLAAGDLDHDGRPELIGVDEQGLVMLPNGLVRP